jgi:hypothetical protein
VPRQTENPEEVMWENKPLLNNMGKKVLRRLLKNADNINPKKARDISDQ